MLFMKGSVYDALYRTVRRVGCVLIIALLMFFAGYSLGQTSTTVNPFAITLQGSLEGTVWVNLCETNQ